jgi:maltose O-acetyltransferase
MRDGIRLASGHAIGAGVVSMIAATIGAVRNRIGWIRRRRRWAHWRSLGMHLGTDVWLPDSTWIDTDYACLISIGDHCGFGGNCVILAHDAQMDEFLDAARIGRVVIHESCHVGTCSIILPGVEIGPRTIVGAGSVVSRTLPPETVCAGNPAKVLMTLDEYLAKHRARLETARTFPYEPYGTWPDAAKRAELAEATKTADCYITGGRTAELAGRGGTPRTS